MVGIHSLLFQFVYHLLHNRSFRCLALSNNVCLFIVYLSDTVLFTNTQPLIHHYVHFAQICHQCAYYYHEQTMSGNRLTTCAIFYSVGHMF